MATRWAPQVGRLLAACAAWVIWANGAIAGPMYNIVDLGTLPGTTQSIATGINAQGQVVGVSYNTNSPINGYDPAAQSFLYSGGQTTTISPSGGPANAINDSGQVVGGAFKDINNSGQYIGMGSGGHEQLFSGAQQTDLPLIGAAINDSGEIAGNVFVPSLGGVNGHAAVYSNGKVTDLNSVIGGDNSNAIAINNNGDILIGGSVGNQAHSVLYSSNGTATDLASLPGGAGKIATALNNHDQLVGNNFLYSAGQFFALTGLIPTTSGWTQLSATRINDAGQIIGQGLINGQEHAFLMTLSTQNVPEPCSYVVFGCLAAFCYFGRLKSRPHAAVDQD